MLDPSERVVTLVQHPAHSVMSAGGVDDRDDLTLGDEFASALDPVENVADRREDMDHVGAAVVILDGAVEDDGSGERVTNPVALVSLHEWK